MFHMVEKINKGEPYIIAEMSANHAGSLKNALEIVRAAKLAGADCLKIQTYTADTMTIDCDNEYFRIKGGLWDGYKLYDLYSQANTPWEWHQSIKDECEQIGIDFLSTPFDRTAVDFLEQIGVEFYKIASFELVDIPLIKYVASKGKPMIISCGMGSIEEISEAVDACKIQGNNQIILLKCSSVYPAVFKDMNLATIVDMRERFGAIIGLSDHSLGSEAAIAGVALGAQVIEKHLCLSRQINNPDAPFSMEPQEFADMVTSVHKAAEAIGAPCYQLSENEKASTAFRKSLFVSKNIFKGEKISLDNVRCIRPGYGMHPRYLDTIIGMKARYNIQIGTPIQMDMLKEDESRYENKLAENRTQ